MSSLALDHCMPRRTWSIIFLGIVWELLNL